MELLIAGAVAIVTNLVKFLVARYGSWAVRAGLFAVTGIAYWLWDMYGAAIDWQHYIRMAGEAMLWYEIVLKHLWPSATSKAITGEEV